MSLFFRSKRPVLLIGMIMLILTGSIQAVVAQSTLKPDFNAEFTVRVMGINVGTASQSLSCEAQSCLLETSAIPDRWARRLANEQTHERIELGLDDNNQLRWLSYQKTLQRYRGNTTPQITRFFWDSEANEIVNPDRNLSWPASEQAFDMIAIIYALRQSLRAGQHNPPLLLQEDKRQTPVSFVSANQTTQVHTQFRSNLAARYYEWASEEVQVKIWLLDDFAFFPGRIELTQHDSGRSVILSLKSPPTF
ncbi:hypothetical protein THIAE_06630 [Thiomicrospira aerophila AL3]|uniref:DUF3108 domain-containing protein n=1 Tax=Thiomicrospira aerophila AL3 TaxID=717772 RepID=W0DW11_9GAMM|nr:DUF3108 domain-containing protein [Thiomicrospira aerophila]AHF01473.1 hypothetical protein THIAE_06630 [Thiomicrospira aerophila AL3]